MGHLTLGLEIETLSDDSDVGCLTCPKSHPFLGDSFTVRNALPVDDFNIHMVCSFFEECGKFTVRPAIDLLPCESVEITAAPASTGPAPSQAKIDQILCEFVWTRSTVEKYQRALVLVWSRTEGAPRNTYYKIDSDGFWFSSTKEGALAKIGTCKFLLDFLASNVKY